MSAARGPGAIRRLWYNWRMMRLPWRKKRLVGFDLEGNTFWEFKDALNTERTRRIVNYSRRVHHSDVQLPPQWIQWLRHTRYEPPSIAEQQSDLVRQAQMKMLAAQADARWAAKPSALDAPSMQQPMQPLESRDPTSGIRQMNLDQEAREGIPPASATDSGNVDVVSGENAQVKGEEQGELETSAPEIKTRRVMKKEPKDSPWKQAAHKNPGEDWQPQQWSPPATKRRL